MNIFKWLFGKKEKTKVFHLGYKRVNPKTFLGQNIDYVFLPVNSFLINDEILEMWDRVAAKLQGKKKWIILLELPDSAMNKREYEFLCSFGTVINLSDA